MADSWIDKTEEDIRDDVIGIAKEKTGLTDLKSTGVFRGFLEILIRLLVAAYTLYINPIYSQVNLDNASGLWLSLWGLLSGVVRKQETKTIGLFSGTAYGTGTIPAGSWIVAEGTELRFKIVEEITFETGQFAIPATAEFEGSTYNLAPGTVIRITKVIQGLDSVSVAENWITTLGTDQEEDEAFRQRIKDKWKSLGEGNPPSKYKYLAESVTGVVEAKIIRTPRGYGSMDIVIASVSGLPSQNLLQAVRDKLDSVGLVSRDQAVRAPAAKYIEIEIEFSGDPTEEEIELAARQYVYGLGIGGELEIRKFYVDPWEEMNLTSFEILSPLRDVQTAENEMIIPQTIIATKV